MSLIKLSKILQARLIQLGLIISLALFFFLFLTPSFAALSSNYTKFLLHGDGVSGSIDFKDETGKIVTAYGNARIDSSQSKFGGACAYFDGLGDYLILPDSDDWCFGSGDFTIDCWVRFASVSAADYFLVSQYGTATYRNFGIELYLGGNTVNFIYSVDGNTAKIANFPWVGAAANTWYHLAFVRSGNSLKFYLNGTQTGSIADVSGVNLFNPGSPLSIGCNPDGLGNYFNGWIDEIRISKGIARWTTNFIPPVSPYVLDNNSYPEIGSLTPASSSVLNNTSVSFTATYSDPDGWQNLSTARILINTSISSTNAVYAYYDQNSNKLYLINDAGSSWLGGFAPGSANIIENSFGKLDCSKITVTGSETSLTVNWAFIFKTGFTGTKNIYLYAIDDKNVNSGFALKGSVSLPNQQPTIIFISPSSGIGQNMAQQVFTTIFSDLDGWNNIQYAYLLINSSINGANSFYGYYNQNSNKIYLRNDSNTAWLGGFAPGSANIIENSYCKIDCSATTVSGNADKLVISWAITFKPAYTGIKKAYLYVKDDSNAYVGWSQMGTWELPNHPPVT